FTKEHEALLLVGTTKGAFLLGSDARRSEWEVAGPYFAGQAVYALALAGRRLLAATHSAHWGAVVSISDGVGRTWSNPERARTRFPDGAGVALAQVWQLVPDGETLWAGVEPAALFASSDGGESWSLVRGLFDHPHRPKWEPGGGGMCLHTII